MGSASVCIGFVAGRRATLQLAAVALLVAAARAVSLAAPATAPQPSVLLTTDFPGVTVAPGEAKILTLTLSNYGEAGASVDLRVVKAPAGWEAAFRARGDTVHRAYVEPANRDGPGRVLLDLEVDVPADARPGDYPLVLQAGASRLELSLRVSAGGAGSEPVRLSTQYPELQGPGGAEFEFAVDLVNRSGSDQTYQLTARAPRNWRVEISPRFGNRQIASIGVKAGTTESLDIRVTPPERVEAGTYPVVVRAAAPGAEATLPLQVVITGTYRLRVTTPSGRLNAEAVAGRDSRFTVLVVNEGSADLHDLSFSSLSPPNWTISFSPDRIDRLPPGESREVTATVRPDHRAIAGDYVASVTARAAEASGSESFRISVRTPTLWGWVGVAIVAAVFAALFGTFRVYGRR